MLVATLVVLLRPLRERLLPIAVARLDAALPGNVHVQRARWPTLGSIIFSGISWTENDTTLAAADELALAVTLRPLWHRDVVLPRLSLQGLRLDVPTLQRLLAARPGAPAAAESGRSFPRPGALVGFPSVAIDTLHVDAVVLVLPGGSSVTGLGLDAAIDVRHGRTPRVRVNAARAQGPPATWSVEALTLEVDLARGVATGLGTGQITPRWPVRLALTTDAPDHFVLHLSEGDTALPPEAMGVVAQASISRRGLAVDSLAFTARVRTPGTSELARVPALAAWLRDRPAAAGVRLAAAGTLAFTPRPGLRVGATFLPGDLVHSGSVLVQGDNDGWEIRCDSLRVADVQVRGRADGDVDSLRAALWLDVHGRRWQDWLGMRLGPALTLRSYVDFRKQRAASTAAMRVLAQGTLAEHAVDRLLLEGTLGMAARAPSVVRLQCTTHGVHAGLAAEIRRGDTLQIGMSPLWLQTRPEGLDRLVVPAPQPATIRYISRPGHITLTDFQVRGDAGDADVDADFTRSDGGSVTVRVDWPRVPALLAARLPAAAAESLRAHWQRDAPYTLRVDASAGSRFARVAGTGSFSLPGPRALADLLRPLRVDDLGALAGTMHFETEDDSAAGRDFDLHLDATLTPWVDTLRVHFAAGRGGMQLHEARLDMESLRLDLSGSLVAQELDVRGYYDFTDAAILQRLLPVPADTASSPIRQLALRGSIRVHGPLAHPALSGDLAGRLEAWDLRVPEIVARIARDSTGVRGDLTLPRGIASPWLELDTVQARWLAATATGWLPGRIGLDAAGQGFAVRQSARVIATRPWHVEVDTLRLRLGDQDLASTRPFQVSVDADHLRVDVLALAGSLGSVDAGGVASRDSTRFSARVALDLPEPPACFVGRRDLWLRHVRADLEANAGDSLHATVTIQGFQLAGGEQPELHADIEATSQRLAAVASVADTAAILTGNATLPVHLQLWPPRASTLDGTVTADVSFARLPFGIHTTPGAGADLARLQGRVVLGGTAAALAAFAEVQMRVPDAPNLAPYALALRTHAGRDARADSLWQAAAAGGAPAAAAAPVAPAPAATEDLVFAFTLLAETIPLVRGDAVVPLRFALTPPFVRADSTRAFALHVRAEDMPLAACNPLLPRGAALQGRTTIALDADGTMANPKLAGSLTTSPVEMSLGDGSHVEFVAQAELAGDRRRPVLRGDIEVKSALIKVPEAQKDLHPTTGDALLQPVPAADSLTAGATGPGPGSRAAAGDDSTRSLDAESTLGLDADSLAVPLERPTGLARAEVDVRLRVPRELWVRGRGVDIEGRGDLHIAQRQGRPTVAGRLEGVRGTFSLVGRTLTLDRATVTFRGDEEVNPALDVQLSTTISGTKIRVLIAGTAAAPELTLSSDPEMEQSDIIALLALGKTYDQLSDEESGIMRERATAILFSMGAAALQENVTQDLGLDLVQYRSNTGAPGAKSSDEAQSGSLAFGKYLSPKVLLSYSYSLDRAVEDVVSLEYFLKGQLTLETLYSVKGQSGLGFGWTKEY